MPLSVVHRRDLLLFLMSGVGIDKETLDILKEGLSDRYDQRYATIEDIELYEECRNKNDFTEIELLIEVI
jgi:hypothetical protein